VFSGGAQASNGSRVAEIADACIREQLERILRSAAFRHSAQHRTLLAYLVRESCQGHADELKEYSVGVDALGRPEGYNPRQDATARIQTGRLRARLEEYYRTEGAADPLVLSIPKGGFKVHFRNRSAVEELGGLRSVAHDPSGALWVGAARGVWRLRAGDGAVFGHYAIPGDETPRTGINAAVAHGGRLFATHSQLGVWSWSIDDPADVAPLLTPAGGVPKTIRAVTVTEHGWIVLAAHDRLRLLLPSQQVQRGHETEQDECHRYRRRRPRPQHRRPVRQVRWHVHLRRHTLRVPHGRPRELVRRLPHGQRGAQSLLQPGGRIERDCRPQQARPRQRRADPADERCQDRSDPSPVPKWKR
jgi:hypothetical protein